MCLHPACAASTPLLLVTVPQSLYACQSVYAAVSASSLRQAIEDLSLHGKLHLCRMANCKDKPSVTCLREKALIAVEWRRLMKQNDVDRFGKCV